MKPEGGEKIFKGFDQAKRLNRWELFLAKVFVKKYAGIDDSVIVTFRSLKGTIYLIEEKVMEKK